MAVVFNLYDQLIEALSLNIVSIKKNFWFLVTIAMGIIVGILLLSHGMNYLLTNYPEQTYGAFVGVVVGSIPIIIKKADIRKVSYGNILSFLLLFGIMILLWLIQDRQAPVVDVSILTLPLTLGLFLAAAIATVTMLIPGISGSLLLVLIGYYHAIYTFTIRGLVFPHVIIVGAGMVFGLLAGAKLVSYLLKRYNDIIYSGILGLILGSLFSMFPTMSKPLITTLCMVLAAVLIYYFNKMNNH